MSLDKNKLLELLPVIYRLRDAEAGALEGLLTVIAEQVDVLQENLEQLYDDLFIETCAEWVVPYIGDLIGYRQLHQIRPGQVSSRAEVANTIAYRRRKGTAAVLEELAQDVTGWPARVVEFFQLLKTTQYLNHLRKHNLASPDLRQGQPLEDLDTAFDCVAHSVDVRRIASNRGRHNIPNIGIFLWRLGAHSLHRAAAARVDARRFLFNPVGSNLPLFTRPEAEDESTHLAEPLNVPLAISRRRLDQNLPSYYGPTKSLYIEGWDDTSQIQICNLADADASGTAWAHTPPAGSVAIDPELGRIAFAANQDSPPLVTFHYGCSGALGGGEYSRAATFSVGLEPVAPVPAPHPTIQAAINNLRSAGVVEIQNSATYRENLIIEVAPNQGMEIRAQEGCRPFLFLTQPCTIIGHKDATLSLNGLVIGGNTLQFLGDFRLIRLIHCTLVPGLARHVHGTATDPTATSLIVAAPLAQVEIQDSITGGLRIAAGAQAHILNCIIDASTPANIAYAGINAGAFGSDPGAALTLKNCTSIGRVHTIRLDLVSNSILLAEGTGGTEPVISEQVQDGCVRFSYLPFDSKVPRRYHCQPAKAADSSRVRPLFTSLQYGDPGYGQLSTRCASEIRQGAEDEAEMGAWHDLYQPQREINLRLRLTEYLRCSLEAGIFYAS